MSKSLTFRQPTLSATIGAGKKQKPKQKTVSLPILIPEQLYVSIKLTCIINALDENPNNKLNESSSPIIKTMSNKAKGGKSSKFVLYSADLLRSWLRYMMTMHIWRDQIEVSRASFNKSEEGSGTMMQTCVRLPSDSELSECYGGNPRMEGIMRDARDVIEQSLLRDRHLMTSRDVPIGVVPESTKTTSPVNMCKVSRLESLSIVKVTLTMSDRQQWLDFYRMEKARIGYNLSEVDVVRVSDNILDGLGDEEKREYNKQAIRQAAVALSHIKTKGTPLDEAVDLRSKGSVVNPAIVQLYDYANKAKLAKKEREKAGVPQRKTIEYYRDMCKTYHTLTATRLDPKVEMKNQTYEYRVGDIKWAGELRASNPNYYFEHNSHSGRICAIDGVAHSNSFSHKKSKESEKTADSSTKPTVTKSRYSFTNSSIYSKNKPVVTKNADIQRLMKRGETKPIKDRASTFLKTSTKLSGNDRDNDSSPYVSGEEDEEAEDQKAEDEKAENEETAANEGAYFTEEEDEKDEDIASGSDEEFYGSD